MKKSLGGVFLQVNLFTVIVTFGHFNTDISLAVWPQHVKLVVALKPNQTKSELFVNFQGSSSSLGRQESTIPMII